MNLRLDQTAAAKYKSQSQISRVITEEWASRAVYCPNCGRATLNRYPNNQPVADFYCSGCGEDYELKSSKRAIGARVVDGAYGAMITRLKSDTNPNLLVLNYDPSDYAVRNLLVIPKHYFVPDVIERRKPLAQSARRAGWIGCNILLQRIPDAGKIFVARDGIAISKRDVLSKWQRTLFLRDQATPSSKAWIMDVMRCVERIKKRDFTLQEMYSFEDELRALHPNNQHIKDKIRQQLQVMRNNGYLEFIGRGRYRILH